jgi:hypothetical protein
MSILIEKWKQVLTYVRKDNSTVPEDKWQECAEWFEKAEQGGHDLRSSLDVIHKTYCEDGKFGGWGEEAVAELLGYYEKKNKTD